MRSIVQGRFGFSRQNVEIINAFTNVTLTTILGQHMDTYDTRREGVFDDSEKATSLYYRITKHKTAYYTFYLALKLAMLLCDVPTTNLTYSKVESASTLMGHLFQVQDDYLDCFGDSSKTGKQGTDIQTAKCSWLLVTVGFLIKLQFQALHLASPEQKVTLLASIGHQDDACIARVKEIYTELEIEDVYNVYSEELVGTITSAINKIEHAGKS
ncbi:bifunctional Polyprenyl synthetase/Isoprenoid synthase domain superfamily/Farnesyl pyrophosphate synthase-like/Polyprenyl synthetase [Babesia duncani]|uniref:Bifunctional Polyprenyl synthetase/Isoprenoid synthase domain superfamily/Farnesyl pyrophosphate synthase-like/Polyprenyl synthetase n=1 Tax=Babesia duncani TaxID=323732 RepID=A0AAD9PJ74_9APIC|nr:bifunctional Polyprenyl synthetase/Isoprenoid synthase domain superfamily/Farnesyl pyrophosphate synthase-like/Polyprenyl synthetase [Babesia duncani]